MGNARLSSRAFRYKELKLEQFGQNHDHDQTIPRLIARGIKVSILNHAHHGFDLDQLGKDSFFHRAAGATEVIISSAPVAPP